MPSYRMTPARKAALKKAQIASARKRRGSGKGKVASKRRKAAPKAPSTRRRRVAQGAALVGAVGAAAGTAYVYKNREKLVIARQAEYKAVKLANRRAGGKLTKAQKQQVRLEERVNHASRSTYRMREYMDARRQYRSVSKWSKGKLNSRVSGQKGSVYDNKQLGLGGASPAQQQLTFMAFRRDVYSRAVQRQAKMHKKGLVATNRSGTIAKIARQQALKKAKTRAFSYDSGKRLLVSPKGKVTRAFW